MTTRIDYSRGPFGNCGKHTPGHVLNALCHFGIPVNRVEHLCLGNNTLTDNGEIYAHVQYFPELEQPLFRFTDAHMSATQNDNGYQLTLSPNDLACFSISGPWTTQLHFRAIVALLGDKDVRSERYKVTVGAGAFFQAGSGDPNNQHFMVEFWNPKGAQAWTDLFNVEYKRLVREHYARATN